MRRYLFTIVVVTVVIAAVVVYLLFDPLQSAFFPRCPFYMLTGFKCPGCGSQRVIQSLLNGDIVAAWHYNAFMLLSLPVIVLYCYAEVMRTRRPALYIRLNSQAAIWGIFAVVVLWWVARNIFGW